MEFLSEYGLFIAKTATIVIAVLIIVAGIVAILTKGKDKDKGKLSIKNINEKFEKMADTLHTAILDKKELKELHKTEKKAQKKHDKDTDKKRHNIFVINFDGDMRASQVNALRDEITAILTVAKLGDEVLLCLESPGGMVHAYGLAASQLQRIKDKHILLTVCVDKIAASGGYLMACVADKIIAAPFAIIGSIGVVGQLPNFHRLLKKNNVDFEQLTAGEYKRTLTMFGENTDKARKKFVEDLDGIHQQFKDFIADHRPQVNIDTIATGEHWLAKRAFELRLVDSLSTSDDYLLTASKKADLYAVKCHKKKSLSERITASTQFCRDAIYRVSQF